MKITAIQKEVLKEMLIRETCAYTGDRTEISEGRIQISKDDGNVLVGSGFLHYHDSGTLRYDLLPSGAKYVWPLVEFKGIDVQKMIEHILTFPCFNPDDRIYGEIAIPAIYSPGSSRLVMVLGENAGGKSFFRRLVALVTHRGQEASMGRREIKRGPFPVRELIHLSMQSRVRGSAISSFIYGIEDFQSTGECSANTVYTGIKTVNRRAYSTIIYWDEPDIGMSAGSAAGVGISIREFMGSLNPLIQAVFVTSHSPSLVRQVAELDPHYIHLGDIKGPRNLDEWFKAQENPDPVLPEDLIKRSIERYKLIEKIMKC